MGIRGEGEKVFPALLERLESGSDPHGLPGVYLPGHPPTGVIFSTSLADLPLPEPGAHSVRALIFNIGTYLTSDETTAHWHGQTLWPTIANSICWCAAA